ncbi:MAG: TlpA family protein disulfide reductase [Anaerolineae bacterium]|nr:TlpA family protein disulfide reductase [Anaerolineae bacterium]
MLNFWASWCPPCRQEAPTFERVWQAYKDRDVVLMGVVLTVPQNSIKR